MIIVPWHDRKRRKDQARLAANTRWANADKRERETQARKMADGKRAKWALEIDPDGTMDPVELTKRLDNRHSLEMSKVRLARGGSHDAA